MVWEKETVLKLPNTDARGCRIYTLYVCTFY